MDCKAILLMGLVGLLVVPAQAQTDADSCPAIQCDCAALNLEQWQSLCYSHEQKIKAECAAAGGEPQSYCGLHGPAGTPVALSIHFTEEPQAATNEEQIQALNRQIATQLWSLRHDLEMIQTRHEEGEYAQAVQVARLLERNVGTLFNLQRSVMKGVQILSSGSEKDKIAVQYRKDSLAFADELDAYTLTLWQTYERASTEERLRNASKVLSFRLGRLVAQTLEQAAYLSAAANDHPETARIWQRAAAMSERLVDWQLASDNQLKHKQFYREQASARWHRATYHWLIGSEAQRALVSAQSAQEVLLSVPERAMVNAENDSLETDSGDISAIRRRDGQ